MKRHNSQSGFAVLYATMLILGITLAMVGPLGLLSLSSQKMTRKAEASSQALFAAESGVEDVSYRIKSFLPYSSSYAIIVGSSTATVSVAEQGSVKTITVEGQEQNNVRKLETVLAVSTSNVSFFYGAHVGDAGLIMDNNSQVIGNVFANGDVRGDPGAIVMDTVTVAGAGNHIEDITVEGDAYADECQDADIGGILYTNNNDDCEFGSFEVLGAPSGPVPLPITVQDIQQWKDEAAEGGVIMGNYNLDGTDAISLGPKKIVGNLLVSDKAVLTLTGNLWVTGSVDVKNDARVRLDASYGATSGVIVADGLITLQNSSVSSGSGISGSYLMYLSTNTGNPALNVKNNAITDIIYASAGWILVENNDELREVTGYGVHLKNNAVVTYETGLSFATFSSGPGAGFEVTSWKEIE